MAEQTDTLSINLKFGSWTLPMTIHRQDEEIYRLAEKLIRDRYNFYTGNYPNQSKEMYLVMTILDIAVRLKQQDHATDSKPIIDRLSPLLVELESVLKK